MLSRVDRFLLILILLFSASFYAQAKNDEPPSLLLIRTALNNYINYEICWAGGGPHGGMLYRFGKTVILSLAVSKDEKKFYVWGDDLQYSIELHHPSLTDNYYGAYSNHMAAIIGMGGPFAIAPKRLVSVSAEKFDFTIPRQCVMTFPPSSEKTAMVNAIVNTMTDFVEQVNREEQFQYPSPLHIVIANFDVNYPRTFVYIEETHEVYALTLHDITNYFGDTFLKEGYPFSLINYFSRSNPFVRKILKYGIHKEINISRPGPSKQTVSAVGDR